MTQTASFQTRARAIDHLGRGQIADAPTAISELWKNAYDAYARNVELRIYDGEIKTAAIYDNGHGMTIDNMLNNWLVIGTESKIGTAGPTQEDMFGLPTRIRQGEKGIGRLSAAFLGPITLVISKKMHNPFSVLLVDWRFFENPFLLINDVSFPWREVHSLQEIPEIVSSMLGDIKSNITQCDKRVADAWLRYEVLERENGQQFTTKEAILSLNVDGAISWAQLYNWRELMKELPDEDIHGTALLSIQIASELSNWLEGDLQTPEQQEVRDTLRETLISFTDPLSDFDMHFDYSVYVHAKGKPEYCVLESSDAFNLEEFLQLEHYAIGECDERGVFTGQVTAFGKDEGTVVIRPKSYLPEAGRSRLGSFKLRLGTFEQMPDSTSLSPEKFADFNEKLIKYGGICMYRDGLRVLPYGRAGADLFDVERRRSVHAGRNFFSYRRTFGGVSFTSLENPNLKDKAGREGLVDNKARRAMVRLVKDIMVELAHRYYGTISPLRKDALEQARRNYSARQKAAEALRKRTKKNFSSFLKSSIPAVNMGMEQAKDFERLLIRAEENRDSESLFALREEINKLDQLRDGLRLPMKPLDDEEFEDKFRQYRDTYQELCASIEKLKREIARLESQGFFGPLKEVIINHFYSNQSKLSSQVTKLKNTIINHCEEIDNIWSVFAGEDTKKYHNELANYIVTIDDQTVLNNALDHLDRKYLELRDEFEIKYLPIINALEQIRESIDLEGAYLYTEQENARLQEKVKMLHTVAQLGITVEIIGHELESLESQVTRNLKRLPEKVRELTSYKMAMEAHRALIDRLRFLTPLKKSSYRNRIKIRGTEIFNYLKDFFQDSFANARTDFFATDSFKRLTINDLPSRIYPTYINLINNALYWVQFTPEGNQRKICLDSRENLAIISDTGSGVDPEDEKNLFELFFSRRANGRGIGLYLCRQNLAIAAHKIRYATDDDPKIFNGANFIIEFNEAKYD